MKVLSVKQPWAYLICAGIKDVENRTWKTSYRGRVLIHAAAKPDNFKLEVDGQATAKEIQLLSALNFCDENEFYSCIIGSVEIVDCVLNHPSIWAEKTIIEQMECPKCGCIESEYFGDGEHKCDRCRHAWWENENKPIYNWILANPVLFKEPILNVKGKLGLWNYDKPIDICHLCGQLTTPDYECEICGDLYCLDCGASYNQFTQIDFNCCRKCGESYNRMD